MPSRLIRARRAISRRIGVGIVALTTLSIVLLVTIGWLFAALNDRQRSIYESVREDALWAAYQTDREALRLIEVILAEEELEGIRQRFDILYSRTTLLFSGSYAEVFSSGSFAQLSADLASTLAAMASLVDGEDASGSTLLPMAQAFERSASDLLVQANAAHAARQLEERNAALVTYLRIGTCVVALTLVLGLIVALLALQLRHSSRTGREIELLSRRNSRIAKRANAASEAKSAFLATMSHEIRTPLNAVLGLADLLALSQLTTEQREHVETLRLSGDMLMDVINDVLDYSKLEAGAVRFEPVANDLGKILRVVEDLMRPRAHNVGLQLTMVYPRAAITADANRIRQILVNLISNAIKFTQTGSVTVSADLNGESLRIAVTDTGRGIAEADQTKLFRDFSQVDGSSTRSFGGSGLGLAICRRLATLMGGKIGVLSQLGVGSTFWLDLPVGPVTLLTPENPTARPAGVQKHALRVLVADDNSVNRTVASRLLETLGATVRTAVDGEDAVAIACSTPFDLVLMDMNMPKLDGLDATRRMRAAGMSVPIIGLTANAYDSDRQACLAAGMDEHLPKPVTLAKLSGILGRYHAATARFPDADEDLQRTLIEELGQDVFASLVAEFSGHMEADLHRLEELAARGERSTLDDCLHGLKGAAHTLGFVAIAEEAQAARHATDKNNAIAALRTHLQRIRAAQADLAECG